MDLTVSDRFAHLFGGGRGNPSASQSPQTDAGRRREVLLAFVGGESLATVGLRSEGCGENVTLLVSDRGQLARRVEYSARRIEFLAVRGEAADELQALTDGLSGVTFTWLEDTRERDRR